ncbi:MAG: putative zinc-binding protein [Acidobacteriia bacterium]|nr:putative zinc-binding protein [Terriglobia bacterium]
MREDRPLVTVVPCSGIGKAFGSVAREAGYELCDELRPNSTRLVALSKLVLGDEEAREAVRRYPAITIDGCKLMCAAKLVRHSGGKIAGELTVLDAYRRHKDLRPDGIAELNDQGKQLARILAGEIAQMVDDLGGRAPQDEAPRGGTRA